jgi:D-alanyl-D-alanine carboxypeptidase
MRLFGLSLPVCVLSAYWGYHNRSPVRPGEAQCAISFLYSGLILSWPALPFWRGFRIGPRRSLMLACACRHATHTVRCFDKHNAGDTMRRTLFWGVLILVGSGMITSLAAASELSRELQSLVDGYVDTRQKAEKISGVALHVALKGRKPIDVYSGTNGRDGTPINDRTLFEIGSNTKHFTAALVLKLEAKGLLNLDQTVGQWLPQYPAWAGVTIRSLLNMTSNIPNYSEAVPIAEAMAADIHHQFSPADLTAAVYQQGLPVPSGWFYSNTNNILAGLIIEAASHMSYKAALETMLLRPQHLNNTFFESGPYPDRILRRLPVGIYDNRDCTLYQPQPCDTSSWAPLIGQDVSHQNLSWAGPAGGMISNTRDLARWIRAVFKRHVLPRKQLAEMTSIISTKTGKPIPDVSADDPAGFALDLARAYQPTLGGSYWYYEGTTFGFRAIFAYWPQYDLVMTTATNSQPAAGEDKLAPIVLAGAFEALQKKGLLR